MYLARRPASSGIDGQQCRNSGRAGHRYGRRAEAAAGMYYNFQARRVSRILTYGKYPVSLVAELGCFARWANTVLRAGGIRKQCNLDGGELPVMAHAVRLRGFKIKWTWLGISQ